MILGMSTDTFTMLHVVISLIGIVSGLIALYGMLSSNRLPGWTVLFLVATVLTSVTGFFFPFTTLLPSHVVGGISLVVLVIALVALYVFGLAGRWRWIYVVTALVALYLNVFVGVVQAFQKLAFLKTLAPTQSEAPFQIAQGVVLLLFIAAGIVALRRFRPKANAAA